jgi:sugar/nucleoside kinase (ribokinase family)
MSFINKFEILTNEINKMNKDIELCGIGNGLVDLQYEISEQELLNLRIAKGLMTLVSEEEQANFLNFLKDKKEHKCSGGSAANTIIGFTQFGAKAAYKTVLGNDKYGLFYASEFKELGIELQAEHLNDSPTGTCLILKTPDSERTMLTSLGASAKFEIKNLNEEVISRSKWIYLEGYKLSQESSAEAMFKSIELAKKYDTKIAFTFSDAFIINCFYDGVKQITEQCDLIFCNEQEAIAYTKQNDYNKAVSELNNSCPNIVVTRGALGSVVLFNGKKYDIPAYKVQAIDSTGAGDMYAAGFLWGIIKLNNPEKAGYLGSIASSQVVTQLGPRLKDSFFKSFKEKVGVIGFPLSGAE